MTNDQKHLATREVEKLVAATKGSRNESRDRCLLLLMSRHGLRVSEALGLKLNAVDMEGRALHVTRLRKGFRPLTRYAATSCAPCAQGWPTAIR